jgi:hypothetical protein
MAGLCNTGEMNMDMKPDEITTIRQMLMVAEQFDISTVIFEPGKVRAMNDDKTVVIYQTNNIPLFSFGNLGVNRLDLLQRLNTVIGTSRQYTVTVDTTGNDSSIGFSASAPGDVPMWVKSITAKTDKITVSYRCTNPALITVPKSRADEHLYKLRFTPDAYTYTTKGKAAMKCKVVEIAFDGNEVLMRMVDVSSDVFKYKLDETIESIDGSDITQAKFSFKYSIDHVLKIFKTDQSQQFHITTKGFLAAVYNGVEVFLSPQK